jgi:hypothetical protein
MNVVTTGMAHTGVLGGIVDVLAIEDGQGIDVGAQSHQTGGVVVTAREHVAIGAGANRQHLRDKTGPLELVDDQCGGAMLVVTSLWVGVNVAPDGDQPLVQRAG